MKWILKLEELALLLLFSFIYFNNYHGSMAMFAALFFIPDVSFAAILISKKMAVAAYNFCHHKGVIFLLLLAGYLLYNDMLIKVGLIFMAHSSFDRVAGYGLKYFDSFDHTHLGWVGKSKDKN